MSIILGIDPGLYITGYGVINKNGKKISYIESNCIYNNKIKETNNRLKKIYYEIKKIVIKYNPDCIATEQIFIYKNVNSALKLSQARSSAIISAINLNIPIFEYSNRKVKKIITGSGSSDKNKVKIMVCSILNITFKLKIDASDALAIAITHSYLN